MDTSTFTTLDGGIVGGSLPSSVALGGFPTDKDTYLFYESSNVITTTSITVDGGVLPPGKYDSFLIHHDQSDTRESLAQFDFGTAVAVASISDGGNLISTDSLFGDPGTVYSVDPDRGLELTGTRFDDEFEIRTELRGSFVWNSPATGGDFSAVRYAGDTTRSLFDQARIIFESDEDGDGFVYSEDCDDRNPRVNPGAVEVADGRDNDCDGDVDEGIDQDGDGFTPSAGDCDDTDPTIFPGAVELDDGRDNDCNGSVDEGHDQDGDGFTPFGGDCDDTRDDTFPGAVELDDGRDNDCDGDVDEGHDQDGDGFTPFSGDCDDSDPNTFSGAREIIDGRDNDCDGVVDGTSGPSVDVTVFTTLDGAVIGEEIPSSLAFNDYPTGKDTYLFYESFNVVTTQPIVVDGGVLPPGKYDSFLLHHDQGDTRESQATFDFGATAVIASISDGGTLISTDAVFGNSGTSYSSDPDRGMELAGSRFLDEFFIQSEWGGRANWNSPDTGGDFYRVRYCGDTSRGFFDQARIIFESDEDGDGFVYSEDCDDRNPLVNPDAVEVVDGRDNDCDGDVDNVFVNDAPEADAGADVPAAEASSATGAVVTLDGSGSTDADLPDDSITYSWSAAGITFDNASSVIPSATFPLGTTEVTLVVTDSHGETDSDTVSVTVVDTTAPVIVAPDDIEVELEAVFTQVSVGAPTVSDAVDPSPLVSGDSPGGFPLGSTTVTWTARDASGNESTATQTLTVIDTTPPTLVGVPAHVRIEYGQVIPSPPTVRSVDPSSVDSRDVPLHEAWIPGVNDDAFTIERTWTASDSSGNTSSATQVISVGDTTPPSLTVPADVLAEATGTRTELGFGAGLASDNSSKAPSVTNDAPVDGFLLGTTTVTWTATDISGNSTSATQTVVVQDTTPPSIDPPTNATFESTTVLTRVTLSPPAVTDAVDPQPLLSNDAPSEGFPVGVTVVTWTATDFSGNSSTAEQIVTFEDTTPPVLTVPADIETGATGVLTVVALGTASATDLVDPSPVIANDAPASFAVGTTLVTWTATDSSGNSSSAVQQVVILGAAEIKAALKDSLADLSGEHKEIENALKEIEKGLVPKNWNDDGTLSSQHGHRALSADKRAVTQLLKTLEKKGRKALSPEDREIVEQAIIALVNVDRLLAETQIAIAEDTTVSDRKGQKAYDKQLTDARRRFVEAEAEFAKGDYKKALDRFRAAWTHAVKAEEAAIGHTKKIDEGV